MNDRHTPLVKLLLYTSNEKPSFTTLSNASVLNQKTSNDENEQCAASILIDDPEPRQVCSNLTNQEEVLTTTKLAKKNSIACWQMERVK
jgi:hypothetical protein